MRILDWVIVMLPLLLLWYCPIAKPWFGFRKPKGHSGKWGQ